jgi:hypothetical protein
MTSLYGGELGAENWGQVFTFGVGETAVVIVEKISGVISQKVDMTPRYLFRMTTRVSVPPKVKT